MDIFHIFKIAIAPQGLFHHGAEDLFLVRLRHGKGAAQKVGADLLVPLVLFSAVVEQTVDVGHPVIEGGEEKTADGLLHGPVPAPVQEGAGLLVIAEPLLHQRHGADAADDEGIDVIGCVVHVHIVGALGRDIVDAVDEKDQVLAFDPEFFDHFFIKFCQNIVIPKFGLLKAVEHLIAAALHLFLQGEAHVKKISAKLSGHGAAQDLAIFFLRILLHSGQRVLKLADHLALFIHIAAADPVDAAVGFDQFSDLADCFFIHTETSLS